MPQTLLLADDSTTIQRVIELTFKDEDITVIAVSDGDQAIARIQSAPPDIVLADIGMPGKNGYEVAEYIKQTPQLAHIPVVLLTGAFEPVDQAKAAAAGCDGVLAKPFEPQIVIGRVRELLGRGGSSAPASTSAAGAPPATVDKSNVFEFAPAAPAASPEPANNVFASPAPATSEPKVEDYFDRLDAAFATLGNQPASATGNAFASAGQAHEAADIPLAPIPVVQDPPQDFAIADAFAAEPEPASASGTELASARQASEPAPIKLAVFEPEPEPDPVYVAPEPAPIRVAKVEPQEPLEPVEPQEPLEPRGPRALPSIADAFSAILAAEQNALGVKPEWPSPASQTSAAPQSTGGPAELVITDDLIDRVARRVLEQMSDQVVRETVADIASQTAERLVREEIERIKAAAGAK